MTLAIRNKSLVVIVNGNVHEFPFDNYDPTQPVAEVTNNLIQENFLQLIRTHIWKQTNYIQYLVPPFKFIFLVESLPDSKTLQHHADLTAMLGSAKTLFLSPSLVDPTEQIISKRWGDYKRTSMAIWSNYTNKIKITKS